MPSLRITAGSLHGRRIPLPPRDVRPTSERARQAYFNIVAGRVHGARFLDLFAGSGAFAFEALSRGAASALAVDKARRNCESIAYLAGEWAVDVKTMAADAIVALGRPIGAFDLVYADPPYDFDKHVPLLEALDSSAAIASGALIAVEHRRRTDPLLEAQTPHLAFLRRAEYGEVWITMYERSSQAADPA